jgi:hypothetical protein
MGSEGRSSQILSSWFEQNYEYRIEEGNLKNFPSKIEAVRRDGGDFDDFYLANLKRHLQISSFPPSLFSIYFETDEFRRFVRIYIDSARNHNSKKKIEQLQKWSVIPKSEIQSRLEDAR